MIKKLLGVLGLAATVALTGCAGTPTVKISANDLAQVRTVHVKKTVPLPPQMSYQGPGQAIGMAFGPIGAAIGASSAMSTGQEMSNAMVSNHIDLGAIARAEFIRSLQANAHINVVDDNVPADGDISLEVQAYGLSQSQGFGTTLYPVLGMTVKMTRTNGNVVWQYGDSITPFNKRNDKGYKHDEYMLTPALMGERFTVASDIVSDLLVANLTGQKL